MLESLRLVIAGVEKRNEHVRNDFQQKFNLDVYEGMVNLGTVEQRIEKIINNSDIEIMTINVPDAKKARK